MKENNIYVLEEEQVTPNFDENIGADKVITITRKSEEDETIETTSEVEVIETNEILADSNGTIIEKIVKETIEIPYETITKEVSASQSGEKVNKVVQEGQNGIKEITYKVKYQNDVEIERKQLSEVVIQEPVNKIVQVSVKVTARAAVSSRGSSAVRTGAGTWSYSEGDLDLMCAITAQESSRSYEGALAVITCACNRAERRGSDPLSEYKRPGQFCYSIDSHWVKRLNGNYPSYVRQAVNDAINGTRNHSYTSFRSAAGRTGSNVIGGNYYF